MTTLERIKYEMDKIVKTAKYRVTQNGVELDLPHDKLQTLKSFAQDLERYEHELSNVKRAQRVIDDFDRAYKAKFEVDENG
jgi:hypothetical protein